MRDAGLALLAQLQALGHAEAVLLVHDGQPQAQEIHVGLDQGMGPHHQLGAGGGLLLGGFFLGRLEAAGEPGDGNAEGLQPGRELLVMLLGEDFRGRHESRLPAALDGLAGRQGGDDGLAAAHVPLQQALHGMGLGQVPGDLLPHPLLGPGELEGKLAQQLPRQGAGGIQPRRPLFPPRQVGPAQGQLLGQQFVELDAAPGRVAVVLQGKFIDPGGRRVQQSGAGSEGLQVQGLQLRLVQGVGQVGLGQGLADKLAQGGLGQAGSGGIDRRQGLGQGTPLLHRLVAGMDHLAAEEAAPDLAEDPQLAALVPGRFQLLDLTAVEIEEAQPQFPRVVLAAGHQLAPGAELDGDVGDPHLHLHRLVPGRLIDRHHRRLVLVAQGKMQQQIVARVQPQLAQLLLQGAGPLGWRLGGLGRPGLLFRQDGSAL